MSPFRVLEFDNKIVDMIKSVDELLKFIQYVLEFHPDVTRKYFQKMVED